ncbi:hypothetical protein Ac2012v2_005192 [Leucoagaricus gongylophorus]
MTASGLGLLMIYTSLLKDSVGTGLTDGFPPGGVDAHDANQFVKKLPYDVMTIGNHELYIYNNTLDMWVTWLIDRTNPLTEGHLQRHQNFAPALNGRYLSSNVNITIPGSHGQNVSVPVGDRFVKFQTKQCQVGQKG